jgi:UDP-N-acetylglucosamine 2-epimerase (non-hydrolysing)
MHLTIIAGARPNFMKIAPIIHAVQIAREQGQNIEYRLIHTGQHYDKNMSGNFFEELNIPEPDANLNCGGGTQAEQTAAIMIAFERELMKNPTDLVMVVGDVTSTMACSIVAKKLNTKVAHVEAGIRSRDLTMPEEINRMVTDSITDYYFTTSEIANVNLRNLGVKEEKIFFVGNVMIDTLLANMERFRKPSLFDIIGLKEKAYLVLTMHRPANVDEARKLKILMSEIVNNVRGLPIIFPIHPRTANKFLDLDMSAKNLHIVDPMGYLEFNYLVKYSKAVITDSGGITEETTVMGIPCITLRDNTERPETVTVGTNELIGASPNAIKEALNKLFEGKWKKGGIPDKWDGKAANRITDILKTLSPQVRQMLSF